MRTIKEALTRFLDAERERAPESLEGTEFATETLILFLEGYGHQYVEEESDEFDDPDDEFEASFIDEHRPDMLPSTINEFLYFWQIRKSANDANDARVTGQGIARLMDWLAQEDLVDVKAAGEAAALARRAADEVPGAMTLGELLGPLTRMTPAARPSDEDEVVEDFQRIARVEPGQLWLTDAGPIAVTTETSDAAEVGWWINVVVERRAGTWYLTELGGVYPRLDEGEDEDDWDGDLPV